MDTIRDAIYTVLADGQPMTVRQVFYSLTTREVVAKTEAEYKRTVCRLLADMRRSGDVPYDWLADATRWMRKPATFSSMEEALKVAATTYRRALWDGAPARVEIWLEKEALAGVLVDVTAEWDVPLMVTRGYPSMSFLYSAAEVIAAQEMRTHIYYLGDRDPSGVDIDRAVVKGITEALQTIEGARWPFEMYASFERVAVTEEQIEKWDLPTRPTKRSDSRSARFRGDSVELDAIPPGMLRHLARSCIESHVNERELRVLQTAEAEERRLLMEMAETFNGSGS